MNETYRSSVGKRVMGYIQGLGDTVLPAGATGVLQGHMQKWVSSVAFRLK